MSSAPEGRTAGDEAIFYEARLIDVSSAIDRAWVSIAPTLRDDGVTTDLDDELEREIRDNAETFVGDLAG